MPVKREELQDDLDFEIGYEDVDVDVDELLAAIHEDHLYEPPTRRHRDRSAWRRIESRRERRFLRSQLSDWDADSDDIDDERD